jgi:hypothetical protein
MAREIGPMKGRQLSPTEIREARQVFGNVLDYSRVRVLEGARWTDLMRRRVAPESDRSPAPHNAMTLGWRCCFPVRLRTTVADLAVGDLGDMGWLVHELAHAWQFQQTGWGYAWKAVRALVRFGEAAYHYGGAEGLQASAHGLASFNVEQQAEIARDYYLRRRRGAECAAWEHAAEGFRTPTR